MHDLSQQARQLILQGDLNGALKLYQQLLEANPNAIETLNAIAAVQTQLGNMPAALDSINKAILIAPNQAALFNSKGNILLKQQDFIGAADAYVTAISLDSNYATAHNNLGRLYFQQDKLDFARAAYAKAIQLQPELVDAHYNYGILLAKLGETQAAIEALEKTIALQPQHAPALGQLGELHAQAENFTTAIEYYQRRLELQPKHANTYHSLGQAFVQQNQIPEAIVAFEQAITLNTEHPECYHDLATAYLIANDPAKALTYFYRQLEIKPLAQSYYNIGVLLLQEQRLRDAAQYLQYAAELAPYYLPVHVNLGGLFLKLNQVPQAIASYQQALQINPDNPEIQHILNALTQEKTPSQAPNEYVEHLFDEYAHHYDKHLAFLDYKVPELLRQVINEEIAHPNAAWTVLDLGCGTGLSGKQLRPLAKKLIGIDLSAKMVATAKQKNIYDELEVMDVKAALAQFKENDLIVAADVFTYIGELDEIFAQAKQALKPGGSFIFSVESTHTEPYLLLPSIRYAHSRVYLERLIAENNFTLVRFDNIILRQQNKQPVEGYLVMLQKEL